MSGTNGLTGQRYKIGGQKSGIVIIFEAHSGTYPFWSRDSCHLSMSKDDHFPNISFVQLAFLYSVRFLLTHPVRAALRPGPGIHIHARK